MLVVQQREKKLDDFFSRAKLVKDDEIKADLARFGVVLVCGYVERCVEIIILERLTRRAHPRILNFIKTHFKRGTNYNCEAICQLLIRFDQGWTEAFRDVIKKNEEWESSLDSAYNLRNSIAHGGEANKGLQGVEAFYLDCKKVVAALVAATRA